MHEADLARHLSRQTALPIGSLPLTAYASPPSVADALRRSADAAVVLDALDDSHLALIGEALRALARERHPLFVVGSGGLSRALALAESPGSLATPSGGVAPRPHGRSHGPVLVVSGSLSPQTRRQTDAAARAGWHVRALPLEAHAIEEAAADAIAALRSGRSVVLASQASPSPSGDALSAVAAAAASVVRSAVVAAATSRVIVCGGDTSGRVARLLGISSVSIAANPEGNVVLLRADAIDPVVDGLELLLKGGQVGGDDLFARVAELSA